MHRVFMGLFLVVFANTLLARPTAYVQDPFIQLLHTHQQRVNAYFMNLEDRLANFEKAFFSDISFANDQQIENYLRKVATAYEQQGSVGSSYVSFTRFMMVNGHTSMVSYTLTNDGHNLRLVRTSNYNGNLLKAVYDYDIKAKTMKAGLQKNNQLLLKEDYSL